MACTARLQTAGRAPVFGGVRNEGGRTEGAGGKPAHGTA
jgi:hypothetical protein